MNVNWGDHTPQFGQILINFNSYALVTFCYLNDIDVGSWLTLGRAVFCEAPPWFTMVDAERENVSKFRSLF